MAHTDQSLRELLNNIAAKHKYINHEIILNELHSEGANYTSKLYTAIIRETNKDDLHLFAKVATMGQQFRDEFPLNIFNTERLIYTKLWKTYETLEEENGVPDEHRLLFTKFYGCDPSIYRETVVLENLLEQNFRPFDRFKSFDWEYASSAVLEIAKLHALSFAYSEKYPQEFEEVVAEIKMECTEGAMEGMIQGSLVSALNTVKPEHKAALEKFLEKYMKDLLFRSYAPILRPVIVHGDYRGSNLLHRVRQLWKTYESLEKENGVPDEHRLLFTKFYGCDPSIYRETVVLENLLEQKFRPFDRFKSFDWEYASSAVLEIAKLHALSFAYSEKYPQEFEKVVAEIKMEWKEGAMDAMIQGSVVTALNTVKPENKGALEKFLEKYIKDFLLKFYAPILRPVIVHGDYRGSNLLHRVRQDGKVDIKIVDLQTLQGGSPVTDLLYFIFTGSDEQFRAQYYDKLIDHYHTQLSAAIKRLHLNPDEIYSREDFEYELKEKLPFGLTLAVFTLPVITVETENAPQVNETLEISDFSVEKTSDLYVERLNGVVNDYVKWGILK